MDNPYESPKHPPRGPWWLFMLMLIVIFFAEVLAVVCFTVLAILFTYFIWSIT